MKKQTIVKHKISRAVKAFTGGRIRLLENSFGDQREEGLVIVVSFLDFHRRMLKAPPVNPRVYIYWYYNIDPKEGL